MWPGPTSPPARSAIKKSQREFSIIRRYVEAVSPPASPDDLARMVDFCRELQAQFPYPVVVHVLRKAMDGGVHLNPRSVYVMCEMETVRREGRSRAENLS